MMSTATIHFRQLRQEAQIEGTPEDDRMTATIVFDLIVDGQVVADDLTASVRSSAGAEVSLPFEVVLPPGSAAARVRYDQLSRCMEDYYRTLVPSFPRGANVVQARNLYNASAYCDCGLVEGGGGW
jgi:hypothetical protein